MLTPPRHYLTPAFIGLWAAWLIWGGRMLVTAPSFEVVFQLLLTGGVAALGTWMARASTRPWLLALPAIPAVLLGLRGWAFASTLVYTCYVLGMQLWIYAKVDPTERVRLRRAVAWWIEHRAGLSIAIPLVTLALFLLSIFQLPEKAEPPIPMKILVERTPPPEPVPEPVEIPQPEPEPQINEVAATRVESQEDGETIEDPVEGDIFPANEMVIEEPQTQQPPTTLADWVPTTEEAVELRALRELANEQRERLEAQAKELREDIIRAEVKSAAKDFELNSDGGLDGAIRTLDVEGFPEHVVIPVLKRYGITYERRYTSPAGGRNFLNAAVTEQGTFRNVQKEGYYDVLVLSNKAVAFMTTKEIEALQERGYDPRTTRVRKIVFGIVQMQDLYDLDVTQLEVEQIR